MSGFGEADKSMSILKPVPVVRHRPSYLVSVKERELPAIPKEWDKLLAAYSDRLAHKANLG